jgi:DNA-binding MarR family transcriptional regulator
VHPGNTPGDVLWRKKHSGDDLLCRAQLILICRGRRSNIFDPGLFGESAWNALLALYADEKTGVPVTIERLAKLVGARAASFDRWINYLEELGLVIRGESQAPGAQQDLVRLSDKGRADLERYLSDTLNLIP